MEKINKIQKKKYKNVDTYLTGMPSLQYRRILGGRNLVRVRNIVVAAIFDFMTVEVSTWRFRQQIARSKKTPALQAIECPLKGLLYVTRILRRF